MKYIKQIFVLCAIVAASTLSAANQSETLAQAKVRAQMARFWQVAEARVAEVKRLDQEETVQASPVRPLRTPAPRCSRPAPLAPPPTVSMVQSVDRKEDSGHFGLQLLGGLRLFDFTWGDERVREKDAIEGRL